MIAHPSLIVGPLLSSHPRLSNSIDARSISLYLALLESHAIEKWWLDLWCLKMPTPCCGDSGCYQKCYLLVRSPYDLDLLQIAKMLASRASFGLRIWNPSHLQCNDGCSMMLQRYDMRVGQSPRSVAGWMSFKVQQSSIRLVICTLALNFMPTWTGCGFGLIPSPHWSGCPRRTSGQAPRQRRGSRPWSVDTAAPA